MKRIPEKDYFFEIEKNAMTSGMKQKKKKIFLFGSSPNNVTFTYISHTLFCPCNQP